MIFAMPGWPIGPVVCALLATVLAPFPVACAGPPEAQMKGVSWVAGGLVESGRLGELHALGADWIAQMPFAFMRDPSQPDLRYFSDNAGYWGESDAGLAETHRLARRHGLKTLLKPQIWLRGSWPGAIEMRDEADWRRWFEGYSGFLLHYARLAECEGFEMLSIGCELKQVSRPREAEMRGLIARVREIYHGPLVYSANWDEVFDVPFWDAVDFIGVNAYFPLAGGDARPWDGLVRRLEALSERTGRRVLLTELGYAAGADCTAAPWRDVHPSGGGAGLDCQARALDAALSALWQQPWLGGVFVWKWFPDAAKADDGRAFDVHGRPAEEVLRSWFQRPATASNPGPSAERPPGPTIPARPRAVATP